jgi:hypothetical protein
MKDRTMRARTIVLASLIGLGVPLGHQTPFAADSNPEPRNITGAELTVIHWCVREVRRNTPGSHFDAHVGTLGEMRYTGTEAEVAAFKRCMQANGYAVD